MIQRSGGKGQKVNRHLADEVFAEHACVGTGHQKDAPGSEGDLEGPDCLRRAGCDPDAPPTVVPSVRKAPDYVQLISGETGAEGYLDLVLALQMTHVNGRTVFHT